MLTEPLLVGDTSTPPSLRTTVARFVTDCFFGEGAGDGASNSVSIIVFSSRKLTVFFTWDPVDEDEFVRFKLDCAGRLLLAFEVRGRLVELFSTRCMR